MPGSDPTTSPTTDPTSATAAVIARAASGAGRVLHLGCGDGSLGALLADAGAAVTGIEADAAAAEAAARVLARVELLDVTTPDGVAALPGRVEGTFEVVVVGAVLQQAADPASLLGAARARLDAGGRLVLAVPNAAHGSRRLALLAGVPSPEPGRGLAREQLFDLLAPAGLVATELHGIGADPLDHLAPAEAAALAQTDVPSAVVEWVRGAPDALVAEFVVVARARQADEPVGRRIPLREAVPLDAVRRRDEHTVAVEAAARDALRRRDEIAGILAETATLHDTVRRLRQRVKRLVGRAESAEQRADELQRRLDARTVVRVRRRVRRLLS